MAAVGRVLLTLVLMSAIYGLGASLYGARSGRPEWVDSARRAMYALAGMTLISFVILDVAFVSSDFSYNIVASGSSTTTPTFYRAAAIWSTQQGSLLLWVMLISCWSSLALFLTRRRVREIAPYAQAVLFGLCIFFSGLTVLFANPFTTSSVPPSEGAGLDPLLRHTTMMIHPPMLYSGYTLLMVPFAFAVGALISGRLGAEWIQVTRRFALAAWLFLGIGILLGARWSYTELGWGGYWAWDPVENAALMPWLRATAFIHSIMIQEKRGMLKVWNASLILATGTLAIIGTFLVRSGDPQLDPRVRQRPDAELLVRRADHGDGDRLDRARGLASRQLDLRCPAGLAVLPGGGVPVSEPAPGRADRGDLLGHVLPADLRGDHRHQGVGRAAGVPAVHRPAGADPGAALGRRADHRLAAGDGGQAAAQLRLPVAVGLGTLAALSFVSGATRHLFAYC